MNEHVTDRPAALPIIGDDVDAADGVVFAPAAQVWAATIGRGTVIGAAAVVGAPDVNASSPKARVRIAEDVDVGANATIAPGVTVGRGAIIRPGAAVLRNVPPWAIAEGNPARVVGYVEALATGPTAAPPDARDLVGGARFVELRAFADMRGSLVVADFVQDDLPFVPARVFWTFDIPSPEVRGEHAHRTTEELIICVAGQCSVVLDDGRGHRTEVLLDRPDRALYVPTMVWASEYRFSPGSVELVLASEAYNEASYIRDYDEFLSAAKGQGT